jgi:hypothetical protein
MEAIENFLDTGPWDGKEFRMEMVKAGFCVSGSKAWAFFYGRIRDACTPTFAKV